MVNLKAELESAVLALYRNGILYSEGLQAFKRQFLIQVLLSCRGNQVHAARQLGMHRNTLSRTLQQMTIDPMAIRREAQRRESLPLFKTTGRLPQGLRPNERWGAAGHPAP